MKSLFRPFPFPLTTRQWIYILILQGLVAGLIDGGVNFAIAYAMYHSQTQVKLWVFSQNTIAGDLGVTPIITCAVSMLITSTLVHTDLHHHAIKPLGFVYPHVEHLPDPRGLFRQSRTKVSKQKFLGDKHRVGSTDTSESDEDAGGTNHSVMDLELGERTGVTKYFLMLMRFIFEGTEKNMLLARIPISSWFGRLAWTAAQGAGIGILFGFPLWLLAIIILGPIYGNGNLGGKWAPQIIKGVYGAIVGWVTNPVIAVLALGSQADCHLLVVEHDIEDGVAEGIAVQGAASLGGGGIEAIPEEEGGVEGATATLAVPPVTPPPPPPPPITPSRVGDSLSGTLPRSGSNFSLRLAKTRSRRSSSAPKPPLTADCTLLPPLPPLQALDLPSTPPPVASISPISGRQPARARASSSTVRPSPSFATLAPRTSSPSVSRLPVTQAHPHPLSGGSLPRHISEPALMGTMSRIRGVSVSGTPASTLVASASTSNIQLSYALGGTGGRAQRGNRPRSSTRVSGISTSSRERVTAPPGGISEFGQSASRERSPPALATSSSGRKDVRDVFDSSPAQHRDT